MEIGLLSKSHAMQALAESQNFAQDFMVMATTVVSNEKEPEHRCRNSALLGGLHPH
ncbi:hypothetical protein [Sphingopyxis sp. LC81]|uniref:hypothetical protein n=1 Tax=Sphingopyxis sp. LC81 TaxID=1502850 RepID=UPI001378F5DF|nr:hypothetical protein [Sphingopyxis sp. LC81]